MQYHYQYNSDNSVSARVKSKVAPDHANQVTIEKKHDMKHLGYDKNSKEFFEIELDGDGKRVKSSGKYKKAKVLD